jgi:tripartite-type tricarboxylate transporter receptor subunit TctC
MPLIASGAVRALARLTRDAPPSMADIPFLADVAGLPDLEDISIWLGLLAPIGAPRPIIDKVHDEVARILADPVLKQKSEQTGNYPVTSTPEEFAAFIDKEAARWSRVIKEMNLKFD